MKLISGGCEKTGIQIPAVTQKHVGILTTVCLGLNPFSAENTGKKISVAWRRSVHSLTWKAKTSWKGRNDIV